MGGLALERLARAARREADPRVAPLRRSRRGTGRQEIEILDNGRVVGRQTFDMKPAETASREIVLEFPQQEAVETITASAPGGRPFVVRDEVVSPPTLSASRAFDGSSRLAVSGLGKHERLTVSLWVRSDGLKGPFSALLNTNGWAPGGMHVQFIQSGQLEVALHGPDNAANYHTNLAPGKAGGWRMITVTYDAPTRQCQMYVNGKLDAQARIGHPLPVNLDAFSVGGWDGERRPLFGQLADMRIYGRVLSADEIKRLLHGRASTDDLLAAWDFSKADGDVIQDVSGHGHDAVKVK